MIELIFVGNELLSGFTINTNASFIGQELLKAGYLVDRVTTVPDQAEAIASIVREAKKRSPFVIVSGGLGPTSDDITQEIVAKSFDSPFRFDEEMAKDLKSRFGDLSTIENQATVPEKAKVIKNPLGTAPGSIFSTNTCTLILLPGVPHELRPMFLEGVLPLLPKKNHLFCETIHLMKLKEADTNPFMLKLQNDHPKINIGIYPGLGTLTIRLFSENDISSAKQKILEEYDSYIFEGESLAQAVHNKLIEKGLTLSTAESCTGGHLAAALTAIPDASKYFLGSIVSYANTVKHNLLGVSEENLEKHGAVSEEVVKEMVAGVQHATGSDFALAVSGIAGPSGGTQEKPVGTVFCALIKKGEPAYTWLLKTEGTRKMIITHSVNALLSELYVRL